MDLSFVLVNEATPPDPAQVIASAAECGLTLTCTDEGGEGPVVFEIADGGTLMVMLVEAPHPDVPQMASGPLSPPTDQLAAAPAHYIVTAIALDGDIRERDAKMAALTAAVVEGCDAAGVMLGHGISFHSPELFVDVAKCAAEEDALPIEICVDITAARESDDQMSFLTHGMQRYDREEFFVTAPIAGTGALEFLFAMVRWMIVDPDKELPTGDTVGRSADELVVIQRVPSPLGEGPEVIRLDLQ